MRTQLKKIIPLLLMIAISCKASSVFAQLQANSFVQIDSLQRIEKRNMVVFIYTDWCKYCHAMKNTSFKNENVIQLLNDKFWFAELNAEEKQHILFNEYTFKYKPTGNNTGIHELAEQLGTVNGKVSYPVLCILNADYEIIFQHDQFLSSDDLQKVLKKIILK